MKWVKPSGQEIETNDKPATVAYCESVGWERKKRKRRTKAEMEAANVEETAEEEESTEGA